MHFVSVHTWKWKTTCKVKSLSHPTVPWLRDNLRDPRTHWTYPMWFPQLEASIWNLVLATLKMGRSAEDWGGDPDLGLPIIIWYFPVFTNNWLPNFLSQFCFPKNLDLILGIIIWHFAVFTSDHWLLTSRGKPTPWKLLKRSLSVKYLHRPSFLSFAFYTARRAILDKFSPFVWGDYLRGVKVSQSCPKLT